MRIVKKVLKAVFIVPLAVIAGLADNSGSLILMGKDSRQDRNDNAYNRMERVR